MFSGKRHCRECQPADRPFIAMLVRTLPGRYLLVLTLLARRGNAPSYSCRRHRAPDFFVPRSSTLDSVADSLVATRHQLILGDDAFVAQHHQDKTREELRELSKAHRRSLALPLAEYEQRHSDRNEAMARAYKSGAHTMAQIADYFGVHYMTVSRAARAFETKCGEIV